MEEVIRMIDERILTILRDKPSDSNSRLDELIRLKERIVGCSVGRHTDNHR